MFPISPAFQRVLDASTGRNRYITWFGTITLLNGRVYNFAADDVVQGSGSVSHVCNLPFVGGAYSAEFQAGFYLNIDPRLLKDAVIELTVRLSSINSANTWDEASIFSWADLASTTWGDDEREIYTDIPMGQFLITEAKRSIDSISVEAYDNMIQFKTALPTMDTNPRTPFDWLRWMCSVCNVELGMTNNQIKAFANGSRSLTYADVGNNVKTCRDLISNLAAVLGAIAVIDRYGKLILAKFNTEAVAEITPDNRFSSEYADYQSYYTGITAEYKAKAVREYYHNVRTAFDTGLIIELGTNVFLQISNDSNRAAAIQAIIDAFRDMRFTPFSASVPFNPAYDLLDVIEFTGGHAPTNCLGPITSIIRSFGGALTMKCATPDEQENPIRQTTQTEGVSGGGAGGGGFYASSDFWIKIASFPDEALTILGNDTVTTELTVNCTVDHTTMQIAWTAAYSLDESARVTIKVQVDDSTIYELSDDQLAGNHVLNVTTGHSIDTKGDHTVRVLISQTAITISGGSGSGSGSGGDDGGEVISEPVDDPVEEAGEIELTP